MLYTIEHYNSKKELFAHRGIGGSSVAAILGVSKWNDKTDVANSLLVNKPYDDSNQTESQEYGTECESILIDLFELNYKKRYKVIRNDFTLYRSTRNTFLTLTPDALLEEIGTNRKGALEIKTHRINVKDYQDLEEWDGKIPMYYYSQSLHYKVVKTDLDFLILMAKLQFVDDDGEIVREEIRYYFIEFEEVKKDVEYVFMKASEFTHELFVNKELPSITI